MYYLLLIVRCLFQIYKQKHKNYYWDNYRYRNNRNWIFNIQQTASRTSLSRTD